ncbi:unnamed protein product, partial [Tetraodon nigroviridis]
PGGRLDPEPAAVRWPDDHGRDAVHGVHFQPVCHRRGQVRPAARLHPWALRIHGASSPLACRFIAVSVPLNYNRNYVDQRQLLAAVGHLAAGLGRGLARHLRHQQRARPRPQRVQAGGPQLRGVFLHLLLLHSLSHHGAALRRSFPRPEALGGGPEVPRELGSHGDVQPAAARQEEGEDQQQGEESHEGASRRRG